MKQDEAANLSPSKPCGSIFLMRPWELECDLPKGHGGEHEAVVYWTEAQAERDSK